MIPREKELDHSDADQDASDSDQSAADVDQTLSDSDQSSSERDQQASDQDQRAAEIDQASSGGKGVVDFQSRRAPVFLSGVRRWLELHALDATLALVAMLCALLLVIVLRQSARLRHTAASATAHEEH